MLPAIPPSAEIGLTEFNAMSFFGIAGPAELPADVVEKLTAALLAIASDETIKQQIINVGDLRACHFHAAVGQMWPSARAGLPTVCEYTVLIVVFSY